MHSVKVFDVVADSSGATNDADIVAMWLQVKARWPATRKSYQCAVRAFGAVVTEELRRVTGKRMLAFEASLAHLAPASRNARLAAIRSLFSFAHGQGYVAANVAAIMRLTPVRNTRAERILTRDEVERLLAAAFRRSRRDGVMLSVLYQTGLRAAELIGLQWRDVTPRSSGWQMTVFGKGGKSRSLAISSNLHQLLISLRATELLPGEHIFKGAQGPLSASTVLRTVKAAAAAADLPGTISPHWLRHSFATHTIDQGAPVHWVSANLGHASLATTARYLHPNTDLSGADYLYGKGGEANALHRPVMGRQPPPAIVPVHHAGVAAKMAVAQATGQDCLPRLGLPAIQQAAGPHVRILPPDTLTNGPAGDHTPRLQVAAAYVGAGEHRTCQRGCWGRQEADSPGPCPIRSSWPAWCRPAMTRASAPPCARGGAIRCPPRQPFWSAAASCHGPVCSSSPSRMPPQSATSSIRRASCPPRLNCGAGSRASASITPRLGPGRARSPAGRRFRQRHRAPESG